MKFDLRGNLVQFKRQFPDPLAFENNQTADAEQTAEKFLSEFSPPGHFHKARLTMPDEVQKVQNEYNGEFEFISEESTVRKDRLERVLPGRLIPR